MHSQRRSRRQVDIFNFSFLDILACVIGLLIFILTIVVISGGRPATTVSSELAIAEHELRDAASAATSTSERRSRAEYLLSQRSIAVIDPKAAADLLRGQIRMLSEETDNLSEATARSKAELRAVRQKLQSMAPTVNSDSDMVAALAEVRKVLMSGHRLWRLRSRASKKGPNSPGKRSRFTFLAFVKVHGISDGQKSPATSCGASNQATIAQLR